jgi:hypothetical protein
MLKNGFHVRSGARRVAISTEIESEIESKRLPVSRLALIAASELWPFMTLEEIIERFACALCGAAAGERCHDLAAPEHNSLTHRARINYALMAQRWAEEMKHEREA